MSCAAQLAAHGDCHRCCKARPLRTRWRSPLSHPLVSAGWSWPRRRKRAAGWASLCRYAAQSMLAVRVSAKEQADFSTNSTNGTELAAVVRLELLYEQGCR